MSYLGRTCPECGGEGVVEECCCECGAHHNEECESCLGTGWDATTIDVAEYRRAKEELQRRSNMTWELMDGGKSIGRESANGRLLVADYARVTI